MGLQMVNKKADARRGAKPIAPMIAVPLQLATLQSPCSHLAAPYRPPCGHLAAVVQ